MWKGFISNKQKGTHSNLVESDIFVVDQPDKKVTAISVTGTDTKTITLTFSDGTTLTDSFPDLDTTNFDNYQNWGIQVNGGTILDVTSQDVLNLVAGNNVTITRNGQNITIDAATGIASYAFNIQVDGGVSEQIDDGETINFASGSNVTLSRTDNTITINSTDTNTIYSFNIGANGDYTNIADGENVNLVGSGATTITRTGNTITISSTDTTGGSIIEGTINVTTNITLDSSYNQKTLLCQNNAADITITVPTGLGADFTCNFISVNSGVYYTNIIADVGVTFVAPHGTKLLTDYPCNIIKETNAETFYLQGELTP